MSEYKIDLIVNWSEPIHDYIAGKKIIQQTKNLKQNSTNKGALSLMYLQIIYSSLPSQAIYYLDQWSKVMIVMVTKLFKGQLYKQLAMNFLFVLIISSRGVHMPPCSRANTVAHSWFKSWDLLKMWSFGKLGCI